jgi:predicted amidophosphoribosyltransferase
MRCAECAGRRLAFASARAGVAYVGVVRAVVAAWKEGGRRDLVAPLAELLAGTVPRPQVDVITYVPGDRERGLARGHVPSAALAAALAGHWALETTGLLRRVPDPRRPRQAGLSHADRRANVRGVFRRVAAAPLTVCLVDDVYTTGATVGACATELRRAGARRVEVVTFARAVR